MISREDQYRYALQAILQEAGAPTMGYCKEVEDIERGRLLEKIADLALRALAEKTKEGL